MSEGRHTLQVGVAARAAAGTREVGGKFRACQQRQQRVAASGGRASHERASKPMPLSVP